MSDHDVARAYAITRFVLGLAMFLAPGPTSSLFLGRVATRDPIVRYVARLAGGRDLLIGAGAIAAYREERQIGRWARYGMVTDTADAVATILAFRRLPRWGRLIALAAAGGGAVVGGYLSSKFGDS